MKVYQPVTKITKYQSLYLIMHYEIFPMGPFFDPV